MSDSITRILHVFGSLNRGGAESMLMNIYREIDKTKIQFDFLVHTEKKGDFYEEVESLGGRVFSIDKFKIYNYLQYQKQVRNFLIKHPEIKVIHGHLGSSASVYLNEGKKRKMFTIAHSHSAGHGSGIRGMAFRLVSYPTRFIADSLFACSHIAGEARFGNMINKKPFHILNNAIDFEKFSFNGFERAKIREELKIDSQFVLGTVGRITQAKNPLFIIDVFKEFHLLFPNSVFMWVGDGDMKNDVVDYISKKGLVDHVILLGSKDDVEKYYSALDFVLFPSLWEGLPMSLIEAQVNGLPILLSDVITSEVCCTPLAMKYSINKSPKEWALQIKENCSIGRQYFQEQIKKAGFDVKDTTNWLTQYYLNVVNHG